MNAKLVMQLRKLHRKMYQEAKSIINEAAKSAPRTTQVLVIGGRTAIAGSAGLCYR